MLVEVLTKLVRESGEGEVGGAVAKALEFAPAVSESTAEAAVDAATADAAGGEEGVADALDAALPPIDLKSAAEEVAHSAEAREEEDAASVLLPGEISVTFHEGSLGLRLQPDRQPSGAGGGGGAAASSAQALGFGARVAAVTPGSQAALCGKIEVGDTVSAVNDWRIGIAQSVEGSVVEGILPGAPGEFYYVMQR